MSGRISKTDGLTGEAPFELIHANGNREGVETRDMPHGDEEGRPADVRGNMVSEAEGNREEQRDTSEDDILDEGADDMEEGECEDEVIQAELLEEIHRIQKLEVRVDVQVQYED